MSLSLSERREYAAQRKARVCQYLRQSPQPTARELAAMEGVAERTMRVLLKSIETDTPLRGCRGVAGNAVGLSDASRPCRARLGDHLHRLVESVGSRQAVAALTGVNPRQQIRATVKPFEHDWTLSQIERLAVALGLEALPL